MSAEKRRNITELRFIVQLFDRAESLKFVFDCQAVAGLRFDGRRAVAEKPPCVALSDFDQVAQRCITRGPNGRPNAAAARGNLSISRAGGPLFEFVGPNARKNRMRMCIDETRHDDATSGVDRLAVFGDQTFDFAAFADSLYSIAADEHRAVLDD